MSEKNLVGGPERISKEAVLDGLRRNPYDFSLYARWYTERQRDVEANWSSLETLKLNVEVAEMLRDAGLSEEALEAFNSAIDQAINEPAYDEVPLIAEKEKLEKILGFRE